MVEVFDYMKQVIDAGAYPKTFTTLKLGESHAYFYTNPGGLTFPLGSWYSSRAFNPPDKGGQPEGFPLGIMQFPAMDGGACPECKTIGIAGTYAINAASTQPDLALAFFEVITREEMARKWVESTMVQTGVKTGGGEVGGEHAGYFRGAERARRGPHLVPRHADRLPAGPVQGDLRAGHQRRLPGRDHRPGGCARADGGRLLHRLS